MPPAINPRFYFAKTGMRAGLPCYVRRPADAELEAALRDVAEHAEVPVEEMAFAPAVHFGWIGRRARALLAGEGAAK